VAEAALNIGVRWGEPLGITDCLNFGSPENPEVMWQFEECIEGISEACETLKIPVISGNVSFYNDTDGKPVYPTPMIGMAGIIEGDGPLPHSAYFSSDLELGLIGPVEGGLGGTALASQWFKRDCGQPDETDLTAIDRALRCLAKLRRTKRELAVHDISDGGLTVASLELAFRSKIPGIGLELHVPRGCDMDKFLFGETLPRVLIAFHPSDRVEIENISTQSGLVFNPVGLTNESGEFRVKQGGAVVFQRRVPDLMAAWQKRWSSIFG
jgi:phosphoribosylformylglycinamidine synthase